MPSFSAQPSSALVDLAIWGGPQEVHDVNNLSMIFLESYPLLDVSLGSHSHCFSLSFSGCERVVASQLLIARVGRELLGAKFGVRRHG